MTLYKKIIFTGLSSNTNNMFMHGQQWDSNNKMIQTALLTQIIDGGEGGEEEYNYITLCIKFFTYSFLKSVCV